MVEPLAADIQAFCQRESDRYTLLHVLALKGHGPHYLEICQLLLDAGADLIDGIMTGGNPQISAARGCCERIPRMMLMKAGGSYKASGWKEGNNPFASIKWL